MSKKYVTRRFRKLHKGRKGRKGYTTRKKMDGGEWRMPFFNKLRQFKNKIDDVPALKNAQDAYRNSSREDDTTRELILDQVRKICDAYESPGTSPHEKQFFSLKQFAMANNDDIKALIESSTSDKKTFYTTLLECLVKNPSSDLSVDVPTVDKQKLPLTRWGVLTLLGDFKSKINNVNKLKLYLDEYRRAGKEDPDKRSKTIVQVGVYITEQLQKNIGSTATDEGFDELRHFVLVDKDTSSHPLKTYLETTQNPIDKREFYKAVYNGMSQSQPVLNDSVRGAEVLSLALSKGEVLEGEGEEQQQQEGEEQQQQEEENEGQFTVPITIPSTTKTNPGSNNTVAGVVGAAAAAAAAAIKPKPPPPTAPHPEGKIEYYCMDPDTNHKTNTLFQNDFSNSGQGNIFPCRVCGKLRRAHAKVVPNLDSIAPIVIQHSSTSNSTVLPPPYDIGGGYLARKLSFRIKKRKTNKKITRKRKSPRKSHRK
jgi:hypothetical protein